MSAVGITFCGVKCQSHTNRLCLRELLGTDIKAIFKQSPHSSIITPVYADSQGCFTVEDGGVYDIVAIVGAPVSTNGANTPRPSTTRLVDVTPRTQMVAKAEPSVPAAAVVVKDSSTDKVKRVREHVEPPQPKPQQPAVAKAPLSVARRDNSSESDDDDDKPLVVATSRPQQQAALPSPKAVAPPVQPPNQQAKVATPVVAPAPVVTHAVKAAITPKATMPAKVPLQQHSSSDSDDDRPLVTAAQPKPTTAAAPKVAVTQARKPVVARDGSGSDDDDAPYITKSHVATPAAAQQKPPQSDTPVAPVPASAKTVPLQRPKIAPLARSSSDDDDALPLHRPQRQPPAKTAPPAPVVSAVSSPPMKASVAPPKKVVAAKDDSMPPPEAKAIVPARRGVPLTPQSDSSDEDTAQTAAPAFAKRTAKTAVAPPASTGSKDTPKPAASARDALSASPPIRQRQVIAPIEDDSADSDDSDKPLVPVKTTPTKQAPGRPSAPLPTKAVATPSPTGTSATRAKKPVVSPMGALNIPKSSVSPIGAPAVTPALRGRTSILPINASTDDSDSD